MNLLKDKLEKLYIENEFLPSDLDYIRGYKVYKLRGYINSRFVIHDESLESFLKTSKIYKYGESLLNEYNVDTETYTLLLCRRDDGNKFKLINKKNYVL